MKRYKQETSILICAYTPDDVMYHRLQKRNDLDTLHLDLSFILLSLGSAQIGIKVSQGRRT